LNSGWIKLHRKILDWEWFDSDQTFRLFLYILLKANYEDKKWRGILIKKGSLFTSREKLANALNISIQSIRTSLKRLKSTNEITIKSTKKYTIIFIVNYEKYQLDKEMINQQNNQQPNQQLTNNQPTTNQQLTITKELNNNKNDKNDKNTPPTPPGGMSGEYKKLTDYEKTVINEYTEIQYKKGNVKTKGGFKNHLRKELQEYPESFQEWEKEVLKKIEREKMIEKFNAKIKEENT